MVAKARIIIVLILSKILLCEFTNKPYFGQLFKYQVPTGSVAQLVEQRTENPRVGGSIPSPATCFTTTYDVYRVDKN